MNKKEMKEIKQQINVIYTGIIGIMIMLFSMTIYLTIRLGGPLF